MVGNLWAVNVLAHHLISNQVRHAYLVIGPDGIGKKTLVAGFSKSLLCSSPPSPGKFCGTCRACLRIENTTHPDVHIVLPEEGKSGLVVDDIRRLQRSVSLTPVESSRRIAILPEFDRATDQAANALLKTLEEPPGKVVMLLTARDSESLLPTIVSRCEILRLRSVPLAALESALHEEGYSAVEAGTLAGIAAGLPEKARDLGRDEEALSMRKEHIDDLIHLLSAHESDRLLYVEPMARSGSLAERRERLIYLLETWLRFWRDILLVSADATAPIGNPDREEDIQRLAKQITIGEASRALRSVYDTITSIQQHANIGLAIENLVITFPRLA